MLLLYILNIREIKAFIPLLQVKNQLSKASQPGLTSVSVAWQQYDSDAPAPVQVSVSFYVTDF